MIEVEILKIIIWNPFPKINWTLPSSNNRSCDISDPWLTTTIVPINHRGETNNQMIKAIENN